MKERGRQGKTERERGGGGGEREREREREREKEGEIDRLTVCENVRMIFLRFLGIFHIMLSYGKYSVELGSSYQTRTSAPMGLT